MHAPNRRTGLLAVGAIVALALTGTALAASPQPSGPAPSAATEASQKPDKSAKPDKGTPGARSDRAEKPDKGPELTKTLSGTVTKSLDEDSRPVYSISAAGATWELSAGPPWYWGDANPLEASVGKQVTVVGEYHEGDTELDVQTVDGKLLRAAGKPPWAGGPKVVGERHPGWKPWKADGKPGRGGGRELAPGQLKQASPTP